MRKLCAGTVGLTLAIASLGVTGAAQASGDVDGGTSAATLAKLTPSSIDSYIVVMRAAPLVETIGSERVGTPAAAAPKAALDASHDEVLVGAGIDPSQKTQDYTNGLNGFAVKADYAEAAQLAGDPDVAAVFPDELNHLDGTSHGGGGGGGTSGGPSTGVSGDDDLGDFLGLTGRGEAWKSGLTGEGVTIGVIDSGIWPEHPSFADDGTYPAPTQTLEPVDGTTCRFGTSTVEPAQGLDAPFSCNNKLIGAREFLTTYRAAVGLDPDEFDSARDDDGHGTHTASTAAGNAGVQSQIFGVDYGKISGVAPRAHLIAYKAAGRLGAASSDLAAAIDQAIADHVDVINYSIGSTANLLNVGAFHLLLAADAGIAVASSAGNDGPGAGTIDGPGATPWVTSVAASTQRRVFRGTVTFDLGRFGWGPRRDGLSIVGTSVTPGTNGAVAVVDGVTAGSERCVDDADHPRLDPARVAGKVVLCLVGTNSPVDKSRAVQAAGGVGVVIYNASDDEDLYADSAVLPTVMVDHVPGLWLKLYIRLGRNPKVTLSTGGTWNLWSAPSLASFSSRGENPVAPDLIKPDLTAPGMQVLAGNSPVAAASQSASGELFQALSGTSMATPIVAGLFALLRQAHPDWTPAELRSALMTSADPDVVDNDRRTPAGALGMGAGFVDPGVVGAAGSAFDPGLVYATTTDDYLAFLCGTAPQWFTRFGVDPATCDALVADGVSTAPTDLNLPSIGVSALQGSTTVTRTVTSVAPTATSWHADVRAPAGYAVSVSPPTLDLAPGASATFTVTITNTGRGSIRNWTDGSLTWRSGAHAARAPIAVRSLGVDAPAGISGVGPSGSSTFTQTFGFTGRYAAVAHGLVAATGLDGTVTQDPDATFSPGDAGNGAVAFPVRLTGVTHARWSLTLPADDADDIDLYLLDSAGNIVAASTNPGTDEQIDVDLPAAGRYTLYVHGSSITEADGRAFSVQQWLVPSWASGGSNLTVSGAPRTATVGASVDLTVAWQGLQPGVAYLGSVTHADAAGIFATTLVDITG